jgi:hypothetical protein
MKRTIRIQDREFPSYASAAKRYGVDPKVFALRISRLGWSPEQAAELDLPPARQEVSINGRQFPSLKAASEAFSISYKTVHRRIRLGWSVEQSLEVAPPPERAPPRAKPVCVQGKQYCSIAQCAREYGVRPYALRRIIREKQMSTEEGIRYLLRWGPSTR